MAGAGKSGGHRQAHFNPALAAALAVGHRRFHDLRHQFAVMSLSAGEHYMAVSKMLGHATYVTTLDGLCRLHHRRRRRQGRAVKASGGVDGGQCRLDAQTGLIVGSSGLRGEFGVLLHRQLT